VSVLPIALSVFVGLALGMLGGGGSILVVPLLVYGAGMPDKEAIATSLLVVGAVSAIGALLHHKRGNVRWDVAAVFAPPAMVGSLLGGAAARYFSGTLLLFVFGLLMAGTAFTMWRGRKSDDAPVEKKRASLWLIGAEGLGVGLITGLVGAGGGFMVVPALVLLSGLPMRAAIGTSLVVIATKSVTGFLGHATHVDVDYALTFAIVGSATIGLFAGLRFARRLSPDKLRKAFALLVATMAVMMLAREGTALLAG
jgi:uncharacterized membrane protein YfcA